MKRKIKYFWLIVYVFMLFAMACDSSNSQKDNGWNIIAGTSQLGINVIIDGQEYTREQLDRYEYDRTLHMLNQLMNLGIIITDNERILSRGDVNWIEPNDAKRILFNTRMALNYDDIMKLFKDTFEDSDRRWREFNNVDIMEQGVQISIVDFTFTGINVYPNLTFSNVGDDTKRVRFNMMGGNVAGYLLVHPEHLYHGIEAMGSIGQPVYCDAVMLQEIPHYVPIKRDMSYPIWGVSEVYLKSDGTRMHMGAMHEFKPFENGFHMRSTFFCPNNAPQAMSEGHKLHFALEVVNDIILVHQELNNN